jgi:hypothetical protein
MFARASIVWVALLCLVSVKSLPTSLLLSVLVSVMHSTVLVAVWWLVWLTDTMPQVQHFLLMMQCCTDCTCTCNLVIFHWYVWVAVQSVFWDLCPCDVSGHACNLQNISWGTPVVQLTVLNSIYSCGSSVCVVTGDRIVAWFVAGLAIYSLLPLQSWSGAHLIPFQCILGPLSSGVKQPQCEANHSPPFGAEVKNAFGSTFLGTFLCHGA